MSLEYSAGLSKELKEIQTNAQIPVIKTELIFCSLKVLLFSLI